MAYTDSQDLNYLGDLFTVGSRRTPFLSLLGSPISETGGINGNVVSVNSFEFPIAVPYDTGAGSQPEITEAQSVTGQTPNTITRGQDTNTCQIFQRTVQVSYKKQSTTGTVGISLEGSHNIDGAVSGVNVGATGNPVMNELDFQRVANIKGMASDLDYCCIQGSYQGAASISTASKTRGFKNAIVTNAIAGGSSAISKTMINNAVKAMVDAGAPLMDIVILCNSYQRQAIGALYEYVPMDRFVGGAKIDSFYTDFCQIGIQYDPNVPADEVYIVDISVCSITVCPVNGIMFIVEPISKTGASNAEQLYFQAGFNYGPEEYHGKITGLATS